MYITLEAPDLDQRAKPLFEGDARAIENVRTSLGELRASGIRGRLLAELPTPRNLTVVMASPVMQWYGPVCVAGLQLFLEPERATSAAIAHWSSVIAQLLADTLPKLPLFDPYARSALLEQIDLIVLLGQWLVDQVGVPDDALTEAAAVVWQQLAQAGKDAAWLLALMPETYQLLDIADLKAPQDGIQASAFIRHLVEALTTPEQGSLPALVAQLEADWAPPA
ncbi:MAG TPA: hypothetical protein VFS21_34410 [Roseiflexaceae bacterium]|nr:hypothetical protein [Roseiflexaceae bacterium]